MKDCMLTPDLFFGNLRLAARLLQYVSTRGLTIWLFCKLVLRLNFSFTISFAGFLTNLIGFLIPAYFSMKALDSPQPQDDIQWWVLNVFVRCTLLVKANDWRGKIGSLTGSSLDSSTSSNPSSTSFFTSFQCTTPSRHSPLSGSCFPKLRCVRLGLFKLLRNHKCWLSLAVHFTGRQDCLYPSIETCVRSV